MDLGTIEVCTAPEAAGEATWCHQEDPIEMLLGLGFGTQTRTSQARFGFGLLGSGGFLKEFCFLPRCRLKNTFGGLSTRFLCFQDRTLEISTFHDGSQFVPSRLHDYRRTVLGSSAFGIQAYPTVGCWRWKLALELRDSPTRNPYMQLSLAIKLCERRLVASLGRGEALATHEVD